MIVHPRYLALRRRTCEILEQASPDDRVSRVVDLILMAVILLTAVAITLESLEPLRQRYASIFYLTEMVMVAIFTVEYLLRLWSAVDNQRLRAGGASRWSARFRYLFTPLAIVDLLAVLPFYLFLFGTLMGTNNMLMLRSIRLLRVLKLTRYSASFTILTNVVKENLRALGASLFLLIIVMLIAASGIYVFEREAQPDAFGSIPAAMWWAFATLTTVGYGDVTPITVGGKMFGASITVIGVGMVALPTAILASAFSEQLRLRSQRFIHKVDEAIEDGVVTKRESRELEDLREALGLGSDFARQIVATEYARRLARNADNGAPCPHCSAGSN